MDIKRQHESQHLMWSLIRYYRNQTATARALHKPKQTFNYWVNGGNIPYEVHIKMEELLKKIQQEDAKKCLRGSQHSNLTFEEAMTRFKVLTCFERMEFSVIFGEEWGYRQGERTDLKLHDRAVPSSTARAHLMKLNTEQQLLYTQLRSNFLKSWNEVEGRTDEKLAQLFHLGGQATYYRLKKIRQTGCVQLMKAVDQHQITINCAAELSESPVDVIVDLLPQGKRAIAHYLKQWRCSKKKQNV